MSETTTDRLAEIEGQAEEPQPVQIREGRWRTRGGDIRHVTPTPDGDSRAITYPWHDARCDQTWLSSGRYHTSHTESPLDLREYLGPIQPEPEQTITTDDVAAEPEPQPVHLQAMVDSQAETIARLHSEIHGLNMEIGGLQTQLQAVKAELSQVSKDRHALQVELDAREQVSQAVSKQWEESYNKGAARAVETIAEWLEPIRAVDNPNLANEVLQHLPQIMRHLTGLDSPEDVD